MIIKKSRVVPKMRESGTLCTKIGTRMGSFSCEDLKHFAFRIVQILNFNIFSRLIPTYFYLIFPFKIHDRREENFVIAFFNFDAW